MLARHARLVFCGLLDKVPDTGDLKNGPTFSCFLPCFFIYVHQWFSRHTTIEVLCENHISVYKRICKSILLARYASLSVDCDQWRTEKWKFNTLPCLLKLSRKSEIQKLWNCSVIMTLETFVPFKELLNHMSLKENRIGFEE